jgi:hypothetical protein
MNKGIFKMVFAIIALMFIGSMLFKARLILGNFSDDKSVYEIKVPDYNGGYNSYLTSEYSIENGCVKFIDEFKFEQEVCDKFTISKWK